MGSELKFIVIIYIQLTNDLHRKKKGYVEDGIKK